MCVCVCERKSRGVNVLSALCPWRKKTTFSHVGIMSLYGFKEQNLISYRRHSDACLKRSRIPMMGVVDFELFPQGCVLSHISVCVRGFPCRFSDNENPFPRYSVIDTGFKVKPTSDQTLTQLSHATTSE